MLLARTLGDFSICGSRTNVSPLTVVTTTIDIVTAVAIFFWPNSMPSPLSE